MGIFPSVLAPDNLAVENVLNMSDFLFVASADCFLKQSRGRVSTLCPVFQHHNGAALREREG